MQVDLNQTIHSGIISKIKHTATSRGKKFITFQLEVKDKWKSQDGEIKTWADRLSINWEPLGDYQAICDGDYVLVHGRLKTNVKEINGEKKFFTNIVANNVILCARPEKPAKISEDLEENISF